MDKRRGRRRGNTLVEVAIAILLTAVIATSIFSIALTTTRSSGRGLRKLVADQASRQMAELLKNYVTADRTQLVILGPGNQKDAGVSNKSWDLTNEELPATEDIMDSCSAASPPPSGSCWALATGSHTVTGLMPKWFEGAPYNAVVRYFVADHATIAGSGTVKVVSITVEWTEI